MFFTINPESKHQRVPKAFAFVGIVGLLSAGLVSGNAPHAAAALCLTGSGTEENPHEISEASHLAQIVVCGLDKYYEQTSNITLPDVADGQSNHTPIGTSELPFSGSYDGGIFEISNLVVVANGRAGLFGYVGKVESGALTNGGVVSNVTITSGSVTGSQVGGLVGENYGVVTGSSTNVSVFGNREDDGRNAGGLVGENEEGAEIRNSEAIGPVVFEAWNGDEESRRVGGLVGLNKGTITTSFAFGNATVGKVGDAGVRLFPFNDVTDTDSAGGFVGLNTGTVENSEAEGDVRSFAELGGGFAGANTGTIEVSHAKGNVTISKDHAGGFVGVNNGTITSSSAIGDVSGEDDLGGFVGMNQSDGEITESSAGMVAEDQQSRSLVSGIDDVGGFAGHNLGMIGESTSVGNAVGTRTEVGGFVGDNRGTIEDSEASGSAGGRDEVGGFAGQNEGTISDSHASGDAAGDDTETDDETRTEVGGFVGYNDGGVITASTAQGNATGLDEVGGFVGDNTSDGTITQSSAGRVVDDPQNRSLVSGRDIVGGFAGENGGTIEESTSAGDAVGTGEKVGGFVGEHRGTIADSHATGDATGDERRVGGFVGYSNGGEITGSTANGDAEGVTNAVGGFAGQTTSQSVIRESSAAGDVEVTNTGTETRGGGFVGSNGGQIHTSFATGDTIVGGQKAGGFVGNNGSSGKIFNSYAIGDAEVRDGGVDEAGGFAGDNDGEGTITNAYSIGVASAPAVVGGFIGKDEGITSNSFWNITTSGLQSSPSATGKTTVQMRSFATFSDVVATEGLDEAWPIVDGWVEFAPDADPARVWGICSPDSDNPEVNDGYPFLLWQFDSDPCTDPEPEPTPDPTPDPTPEVVAGGAPAGGAVENRADDAGIHLDFQVRVGDLVSGLTVGIGGQGLFGGSEYSLVVRSTPQILASGKASALGNFGHRVTMPALSPGSHTLTLTATALDGSVLSLVQAFTVGADGTITALSVTGGTQVGGLAVTGVSGIAGGAGLAGLAMLLGIAMVMSARRHESVL